MIPIPEVLKRGDVSEKLIFHPFAEAAAKGESDVVEDLRGRFALQPDHWRGQDDCVLPFNLA